MELLTYVSDTFSLGYRNWVETAKYHGFTKFSVVGQNEKWINFKIRTIKYRDHLLRLQNPERIVAVTDCYDVLVIGDIKETIGKFLKIDRIVMGAERMCFDGQCYPDQPSSKQIDNISSHKYVNAGVVIGRVKELIFMYNYMIDLMNETKTDDDQWAMGAFASHFPEKCFIDHSSELVGNFNPFCWHDFNENPITKRIQRTYTGATPCFIHTPASFGDAHYRYNYITTRSNSNRQRTQHTQPLEYVQPFADRILYLILAWFIFCILLAYYLKSFALMLISILLILPIVSFQLFYIFTVF